MQFKCVFILEKDTNFLVYQTVFEEKKQCLRLGTRKKHLEDNDTTILTRGGRNVDDQNVDRPKISERQNGLFS